jgi:hypothetical protein
MGWWSLSEEDEEMMDMPPPPPTRRARGGAGRVPGGRGGAGRVPPERPTREKKRSSSPGKSKRKKSPEKKKSKVVIAAPEEEEPNLFASIGRMVGGASQPRQASDASTIGTAKYPGANGVPVKASSNANEATRRANEMANAMAWLTNPAAAAAAEEEPEPEAGADLFGDDGNWWESELDAEADDDMSLFSNNSSLLTEDMPDLMALLMHRQDETENEKKKAAKADARLNEYKKAEQAKAEAKKKSEGKKKTENKKKAEAKKKAAKKKAEAKKAAEKKTAKKVAKKAAKEQEIEESESEPAMEEDTYDPIAALAPDDDDEEPRTKELSDTLDWWSTYNEDAVNQATEDIEDLDSMKQVVGWWSTNMDYKPPSHKKYDADTKKAMKVNKTVDSYKIESKELSAEKKAKELESSLKWIQDSSTKYTEDAVDFEYNQGTFKKVNDLFGQWMPKGTPALDWESYDPREDPKDAETRAKDLKGSLGLVLSGAFDTNHPNYNCAVINRLKDLFADWKLKEDDGVKELEDTLSWWKLNATKYDPLTASADETDMFLKSKKMLAMFGLKDGDVWDKRNEEMAEAMSLWTLPLPPPASMPSAPPVPLAVSLSQPS